MVSGAALIATFRAKDNAAMDHHYTESVPARKERPILFSGPMVWAILEGRKTQTRRILKPGGAMLTEGSLPKYKPGDRLWVRESWSPVGENPDHLGFHIRYKADEDLAIGGYGATKWRPSIHLPRRFSRLLLDVTAVKVERLQDISEEDCAAEGIVGIRRRPKYRMDGYGLVGTDQEEASQTRLGAYSKLWESINGPKSWDLNPWVTAITFQRVTA